VAASENLLVQGEREHAAAEAENRRDARPRNHAADEVLRIHRSLTTGGGGGDQSYWDLVTVLDLVYDLDPKRLPPAFELARFERYVMSVLARLD
jgi:hypothetical protein